MPKGLGLGLSKAERDEIERDRVNKEIGKEMTDLVNRLGVVVAKACSNNKQKATVLAEECAFFIDREAQKCLEATRRENRNKRRRVTKVSKVEDLEDEDFESGGH